jgi:hypothetical protein
MEFVDGSRLADCPHAVDPVSCAWHAHSSHLFFAAKAMHKFAGTQAGVALVWIGKKREKGKRVWHGGLAGHPAGC